MTAQSIHQDSAHTYLNPVYPHSFPDPFVLKHRGEYWAYCTSFWNDELCFGVLHSRDLVNWREVGGAMRRIDQVSTCYWAPEVTYADGYFYLYYSVGNEENMHLRVAVAEHPAGPFVDSGRILTTEQFAIDAHVYTDDDGTRYLFYATDFLTYSHIGTGTVVDRLIDPFTLAGEARPVTRARFDWQVYDPARREKGGVRWHTVEGPAVLKHKNLYYQMFSGGNWKNMSYGVSYAITDDLATVDEWRQVADGERVLPILRTLPGKVIGPGHNSVVRGPDNRQLYCIYHRWADDGSARLLAIDPLDWAGERMLIIGPSFTPQPAPLAPSFTDYFDETSDGALGSHWKQRGGNWLVRDNATIQEDASASLAEASYAAKASSFVLEVSLRALLGQNASAPHSRAGLNLKDERGDSLISFVLSPDQSRVLVSYQRETENFSEALSLPAGFASEAYHLLRIEVDGATMKFFLDEGVIRWQGKLSDSIGQISLFTENMSAAFSGFQLTYGWEDLFTDSTQNLRDRGWEMESGNWIVQDGELRQTGEPVVAQESPRIIKGPLLDSYELVVNARQVTDETLGGYEFYPALDADNRGPLISIEQRADKWVLVCGNADVKPSEQTTFALPESFDPAQTQQFRFRKQADKINLQWEAEHLGVLSCAGRAATRIGLGSGSGAAAFEMVRVTEITEEMLSPNQNDE